MNTLPLAMGVFECAWDDNKHSVNMLTQKLAYSYDDGERGLLR